MVMGGLRGYRYEWSVGWTAKWSSFFRVPRTFRESGSRRRNRASRSVPLADLAAEIVYLVNRYSEVARGAMIAGKVVDELLALPAAVTRAAKIIGDPAQNCE